MKTARELLMDGLKAMGADGLCNRDGQCGCGICDLAPLGDCINIEMCEAAKFIKPISDEHEYWDEYPDGYYTPIQEEQ